MSGLEATIPEIHPRDLIAVNNTLLQQHHVKTVSLSVYALVAMLTGRDTGSVLDVFSNCPSGQVSRTMKPG